MPMKEVVLKPIKITTEDFDAVEEKIKELFKKEIYFPILRELNAPRNIITNSIDDLSEAFKRGKLIFKGDTVTGRLNSRLTKELRELGARWDKKSKSFKVAFSLFPAPVQLAVLAGERIFKDKLAEIDRNLAQKLPEEIAGKLSVSDLFDHTLWKTNRDFQSSIKGVTVASKLTDEARKKIADEWQNNMQLWIKDFTEEQIKKLRADLQTSVFAGNRYESAISTIQKSYGVSANKAKFLARQETSLLMAKFKKNRYADAGVYEYKWGRVSGTPLHPVRPQHKKLAEASDQGKIYRWDDPPITSEPGTPTRRNNAGEDYNCRCFPKPVVRFRVDDKI